MRLRFSPASPFTRKVTVTALELDLDGRIHRIATSPWDPESDLDRDNPLCKVPALTIDDGTVLFDSPVICEYLDSLHQGHKLFPAPGPARWAALRLQALADGMLDAAVLRLVEKVRRPAELRWPEWDARQKQAIDRALDLLERERGGIDGGVTIAEIAIGCALGYLDFRFAAEDWRAGRPKTAAWYEEFAERPSMRATVPDEHS
jgi:glutathione S-transferase